MQLLKEELGHHQLKMDEYEALKTEYEKLEGNLILLLFLLHVQTADISLF